MPGQHSDGSIIIDTRVDNSGAMIGIKKLHELVNRFHSSIRNVGASVRQSSSDAVSSMQEVSAAYDNAAMNATQAAKAVKQINSAIAKTERQIAAQESKLAEYYSEIEQIKASTDEALKNTTSDDQAARLLEIEDLQIQQVNEKYATQLQQLEALKTQLADYQAKAAQFDTISQPAGESEEALKGVDAELKQKKTDASEATAGMSVLGEAFRSVAARAAQAAVHVAKVAGRAAINGIKSLWQHTKNAAKAFLTLGKNAKKAHGGIGASFKTILKYGLGIRSLYVLFNKLRRAFMEGFGNLAQYSTEINASVSMVLSSLTKLKNQFAAAFAPLVEVVAPALTKLIEGLVSASEKLGQLVGALTGRTTFIKAKDVQEDYAESLKKTADEAKEAKRQLAGFDELQILKKDEKKEEKTDPSEMFEEEEIPEDIQDLADDIKDAIEDTDWTPIGRAIGDKIKSVLDGIDWDAIKQKAWEWGKRLATLLNGILETPGLFYKIGQTLAEAINTAFSFLDGFAWNFHWDSLGTAIMDTIEGICDTLDWKLINHALQGLASGLAETINTIFARRETWEKVGQTFGNGINAIVDAGLTFLRKIDFMQIGSTIAAGLNKAVKAINWENIGKLLAEYIAGLFEMVYSLAKDFDWKEFAKGLASGINGFFSTLRERLANLDWKQVGLNIATGINNFLKNVDWSNMAGTISDAIKNFLDLVLSILTNINWQALGDVIADLILGIDWIGIAGRLLEIGVMLIAGILQGMMQAIARIGIWIKENIIDPIVGWFKKLFGIHSPSTVMAEIGGFLAEGLLNGILDGVKNIGKFLKKNVAQPIQKFFKDPIGTIKLAVDDSWKATQQVWESVKDSEAVKTIEGYVRRTFDTAKTAFDSLKSSSVIKSVSGFVEKSFDEVKTVFNNFKDGDVFKHVRGVVESAFHEAKGVFDAFKDGDVFKRVKGRIEDAFKTAKGTFDAFVDGSVFKHICGVIESTYNTARDTFDAFKDGDVFKHVKGKVEDAFNTVKDVFDAFKDGDVFKIVKGKIDSAYTTVKSTFDSFINGDVFKIVKGQIDNAYTTVKSTFDSFINGDVFKIVKGQIDATFTSAQQTFNALDDAPVFKTIKAAVEKASTWVSDAWEAAQMTAGTVRKTVQAGLEKASTWVSDAWTVIQSVGQNATTTVKAILNKSSYSSDWNADAWTVIQNAGKTVQAKIQAFLSKATSSYDWNADAWKALSSVGDKVKATVQTALEKASSYSWNDDAWKALGAVGKTQVTTLEVSATRKSNYGTEAQTWAALTSGSVIEKTFRITVDFVNTALNAVKKWLGLAAEGGIFTMNGRINIPQFAGGGIIRSIAGQVRAYAGGTTRAHGSLFLAGEAGPEVVAHINGRTEVLNRSQIASAIYSAVLAGMEAAVNGLGAYIGQRMTDCANAIIGAVITATQINGPISVRIVGEEATLIRQLGALTGNIVYAQPIYSTGTNMPYEVAAEIQRQTSQLQHTIDAAADEIISSNISALGSLGAMIVSALQQYGGGNGSGIDADSMVQQTIDEINRRTMSMGRSPLLG